MDTTESQIAKTLGTAETELRNLLISAAKLGDYGAIDLIRSIALELRRLGDSLDPPASGRLTSNDSDKKPSQQSGRTTKRRAKSSYPRFFVRNGTLSKVGWSKKKKEEYIHKIPRESFDIIVRSMAQLAKRKRGPYSSDEIKTELEGMQAAVPAYQVYVTVALLRDNGCVTKRGREGHVWSGSLDDKAAAVWGKLPSEQA